MMIAVNYRNMMWISAILAGFMGSCLAALPVLFAGLFGVDLDSAGAFLGRMYGAGLLGFGLLSWCIRDLRDSRRQRAVLASYLLTDCCCFLAALNAQLGGVFNPAGWAIVVPYFCLCTGFVLAWPRPTPARTLAFPMGF
jgi:hypothetical protein